MLYQYYEITKIEQVNVSEQRNSYENGYLVTIVFTRQNNFTCVFKIKSEGYPSEELIINFLSDKMQEIGSNLFIN